MLSIDTNTFRISLTRGDNAIIQFSASTAEGDAYEPQTGDILVFAVAVKIGDTPLFQIENSFDEMGDDFWNIAILPEHTKGLEFKNYVYDVQLKTATGIETIIGKTDTIKPTFTVWGEVSE